MGIFKPKESFNPKEKLNALAAISREWNGLLISKLGKEIIELCSNYEKINPGEWLYFAFHWESMPDGRIVIVDAACIWVLLKKQVNMGHELGGNEFQPLPKALIPYIIPDGVHKEWEKEIQAIDRWFNMTGESGWKNQWSWRTDRVKRLLDGKCKNWISKD